MFVLLATAVVAGTVAPASANTELVPGSRLVYPYIDISSARETFLIITNSGGLYLPVHVEFYSQSCLRTDRRVDLTGKDIAALQVSTQVDQAALPAVANNQFQQNIAGIGWADVDVRYLPNCTTTSNLAGCSSVEYNGLMGTAVIIDIDQDWAFAYPAAASQGSAANGFSTTTTIIGGNAVTLPAGVIVTRNPSGFATAWTGTYETYPSTHMIPAFFAEDPCAAASPTLKAFISLVGPADAWRKEGPGAPLGTSTLLVQLNNSSAYDGAENAISVNAEAHHVNGRLCTVFGNSIAPRTLYHDPPGYASFDIIPGPFGTSKNAVGWLELSNAITSPSSSTSAPAPNPSFTTTAGFDNSVRPRGLVGLIFEIQQGDFLSFGGTSGPVNTADVVRSWADPASAIDWPCFGTESLGITSPNGGRIPPTIVAGFNAPTCESTGFPEVRPYWLCDHAQTVNGGQGVAGFCSKIQ
jgi:hypothetical protein